MRLFPTLLFALHCCILVGALDLHGAIHWNDLCPEGYQHIRGAKVVLDDARWSANIRSDGRFVIPDVDPGTFVLNVLSHDFQFDQLRIDVAPADPRPAVHPYVPGTPLSPPASVALPYPIALAARSKNVYFVEHEAFNPLGMLKSPMMLIMIVTGAMLFATPYLMANMDRDTLDQVKGKPNKIGTSQNFPQNNVGLAKLLGGESGDGVNSLKPAPPTPARARGKGKKR